jgi:hypothetical protein
MLTSEGAGWFQKEPPQLPFDRALFRSVDLRQITRLAVKEAFHVVDQKTLRFRITEIESVMIDDPGLGLQPFGPAELANLLRDFLSQIGRQRGPAERRALLLAASTFNFF